MPFVVVMNNMNKASDFSIKQKAEGKVLLGQILCYIFYIAVVIAFLIVAYKIGTWIAFIACVPIIPTLIGIVRYLTWPYVSYEKKYKISIPSTGMGQTAYPVITFSYVRSVMKRPEDKLYKDEVYKNELRKADLIAPYTAEYEKEYNAPEVKRTIDHRGSRKATDVYFARFVEDDGSKTVVIFQTVSSVLETFKYYAKEQTVMSKLSR